MADRPQIKNWNNINQNKPEEYSSEFQIGDARYANVTNVSTGQRQLYFVSGIYGTALTQRSLLTSTNADGSVTKGSAYDDFVRRFGKDKLNAAEKANKQQSVSLLSNPNISTSNEAKGIAESKEFKSTSAGENAAKTADDPEKQLTSQLSKEQKGTRNEFPGKEDPLRYPLNLKSEYQDVIRFNMLKYEPRKPNEGGEGGLGSFGPRSDFTKRTIGRVVLPIPAGISDQNAVTWGSGEITSAQKALADLANAGITGGGAKASETAGRQAEQARQSASEIQTGLAAYFTEQAVGVSGILSRTQGAVQNPNMELLFQAPTLRPFSFTFKLSARSDKEAQAIRSIIRFFKQGMSPIRTQSQLFLKAPHTFQLEYLHKNESHSYLNKFKECALQSFSVNYTPEGQYATFTDGAMVSYLITMQFQELEPVFNDDYSSIDQNKDIEIGY
jgi:hypothetical protein